MSLCQSTATRLLYLRDQRTLKGSAQILRVISEPLNGSTATPSPVSLSASTPSLASSEQAQAQPQVPNGSDKVSIILDASSFYPQGGGQPSDTGEIEGQDWKFNVEFVRFDAATDQVHHQGTCCGGVESLLPGTPVTFAIDEAKRNLHNRLHSAGHVLDLVLFDVLGYGNDLKVGKGYHFPQGPSVEYEGKLPNLKSDPKLKAELIKKMEEACNELVKKDLKVFIAFDPKEEFLPNGLPNDKAMRWMSIEGFDRKIPCGGTHVSSLREIGSIKVRKIEAKESSNLTRIGYQVDPSS